MSQSCNKDWMQWSHVICVSRSHNIQPHLLLFAPWHDFFLRYREHTILHLESLFSDLMEYTLAYSLEDCIRIPAQCWTDVRFEVGIWGRGFPIVPCQNTKPEQQHRIVLRHLQMCQMLNWARSTCSHECKNITTLARRWHHHTAVGYVALSGYSRLSLSLSLSRAQVS